MTTRAQQVGVIGAGAWGTALALVAARAGHQVILWAREPETSREINATRENKARLPDIRLPEEISATSAPEDLSVCDLIMIATPAQAMREVMERFRPHLQPGIPAVITAKGIEQGTSQFLTGVRCGVWRALEPMILSGPSFAADVARQLPTAVAVAARSLDQVWPVAEALSSPPSRPYISVDRVGVQVGGAVKNVL